MKTTPEQIRAARALVGMSQKALAEAVGVSTMSIKRAEGTGQPPATTDVVERIRAVLEASGAVFLPGNGQGPGVALRKD